MKRGAKMVHISIDCVRRLAEQIIKDDKKIIEKLARF
jgi:hypothetical protein